MPKRLLNASASVLIALGLGACSSPPTASPPGTLPAGTARVTINDSALPDTHAVKCIQMGSLTVITTGDTAGGVASLVSNEKALTAKSVTIHNVGGFTGSYMQGLSGEAAVSMNRQTYLIRGNADGFDDDNPSTRATGTFAIQVAC